MLTAMSVEEEQQKFAAPEAVEMYKNVFEGFVQQAMSESRNHRQPMYTKSLRTEITTSGRACV